MRKRIGLTMVAAISAVSLLAASSASAATEVGSNCLANTGTGGNATAVQLAKVTGDSLPIAAPISGVVTKWKVNSGIEGAFAQQLKVLRPAGNAKTFLTVAESAAGQVVKGQNSFAAQIPVQAGDRFGVAANSGAAILFCATANAGDAMGLISANVTVGSTNEFPPTTSLIAAISATIEPDADNDGFGDETQDKCPRSAAIQQVACPLITLGGLGKLKKGSAQILVSASSQAPVTVFGSVKIPKKGKKGKARQITLQGGTQSVSPGTVIPFNLVFPPTLKSALAALPPSKSLPLFVTMATTDLAGQASASQLTLKLKGQKKGKAKAKGKSKAKGKKG
jgi:hypothetical protein